MTLDITKERDDIRRELMSFINQNTITMKDLAKGASMSPSTLYRFLYQGFPMRRINLIKAKLYLARIQSGYELRTSAS